MGKNTALFLPHKEVSAEGPGEDRHPRMKGPGLGMQTGESRAGWGTRVSDYSPLGPLCTYLVGRQLPARLSGSLPSPVVGPEQSHTGF